MLVNELVFSSGASTFVFASVRANASYWSRPNDFSSASVSVTADTLVLMLIQVQMLLKELSRVIASGSTKVACGGSSARATVSASASATADAIVLMLMLVIILFQELSRVNASDSAKVTCGGF